MFDTYGIHLGPLYIRFYALFLVTGMIWGAYLVTRRAPKFGLDPKHVWDGLVWAIIPGLIGARLYHVLTPSPGSSITTEMYFQNPILILNLQLGGLGIYGAIVGGIIGLLIYGTRHKQPILRWFDVIVPALALGQAIGRWGNWVNQELYGAPTNLPWAIYIAPENRVAGFAQYEYFHPLFLYEFLWNIGTCLLLIYVANRFKDKLKPGDVLCLYLMAYPTIRFLLDFLRLDSHHSGALTTAQLVSALTFGASLSVIIVRRVLAARHIRTATPNAS